LKVIIDFQPFFYDPFNESLPIQEWP